MRPVPKAKRWRTRLAVRRGRRLHYQGWDAWRQTSWPKRHGATRTTVIQDKSANECVENEPLENRVQNEQPSVCTAGKFLALTLLACAWTVLCVVVAPVGWHLAPLSLRPKGTRISGAAPSAQI